MCEIVKADTNNDSRLTIIDKVIVTCTDPEGKNYTEVLTEIDEVVGYEIINKMAIDLIFNRANQGYTAYVNLVFLRLQKK